MEVQSEDPPAPSRPDGGPWLRSLIVPMHDESQRIVATIERIAASWIPDSATELIFVDDGSEDGTAEVVEKALAASGIEGIVIRLASNVGKGGAVRAGVLRSSAPVVGFVDADLSTDVDEVRSVFRAVECGGADVAIATRAHHSSEIQVHQPALRQLSGKLFNLLLRSLSLTAFHDTQCGLKAFRSDVAQEVFHDLRTLGFAFDIEVLVRAERAGHRIQEVPVRWSHVAESSVRAVRDSSKMLRDALRIRIAARAAGTAPATGSSRRASSLSMDREAYDAMSRVESEHWWFRAKRNLVMDALATQPAPARAVDVGCGAGAMTRDLEESVETVFGTDFEWHALDLARQARGTVPSMQASADALPLCSRSVDCVVSLDVIEHVPDDVAALAEFCRVGMPEAVVIVAVPAYMWAWSEHDVRLGHRRRYTRRALVDAAERAGLQVSRATYFHSWLVPAAVLMRRTPLRRVGGRASAEEASMGGARLNKLLRAVTEVERKLLSRIDLPFGLSLLIVCRVPAGA